MGLLSMYFKACVNTNVNRNLHFDVPTIVTDTHKCRARLIFVMPVVIYFSFNFPSTPAALSFLQLSPPSRLLSSSNLSLSSNSISASQSHLASMIRVFAPLDGFLASLIPQISRTVGFAVESEFGP